jgi:hypothetical protein
MEGKPMTRNMPKVVRLAIAGAVFAIAVDYFLKPTVSKTLGT